MVVHCNETIIKSPDSFSTSLPPSLSDPLFIVFVLSILIRCSYCLAAILGMHTLMSNQQYYEALASSNIVNKQGLNSM